MKAFITRYDSEADGMPPINLLAFRRWLDKQTEGMDDAALSRCSIVIDTSEGCHGLPCAVVEITEEVSA